MNTKIKQIINKTHQGLENIYGEQLEKVILFGSQARGDATSDSDIDILIVFKIRSIIFNKVSVFLF